MTHRTSHMARSPGRPPPNRRQTLLGHAISVRPRHRSQLIAMARAAEMQTRLGQARTRDFIHTGRFISVVCLARVIQSRLRPHQSIKEGGRRRYRDQGLIHTDAATIVCPPSTLTLMCLARSDGILRLKQFQTSLFFGGSTI